MKSFYLTLKTVLMPEPLVLSDIITRAFIAAIMIIFLIGGKRGFDGFVMSDLFGSSDTVETAKWWAKWCWTKFFGDNLVKAVKDGLVPEEKINEAALRIVRTVLAFTEADNKTYDKSLIGCKEHVDLALEAAEKGITLIKNDNNTLSLDRDQAVRIAVIGKLADKGNIGDYGSSRVFPEYIVTPLEGIANCAPNSQVIFYNGMILITLKGCSIG